MAKRLYITAKCYIDTELHMVINGDQSMSFPPQTWDFMGVLIEKSGKIVSHEDIMKSITTKNGQVFLEKDKNNSRKHKGDAVATLGKVGLTKEEIDSFIVGVQGVGYGLRPYAEQIDLGPVIESYIGGPNHRDAQRAGELRDTVDLMLSQGLSGKMGRHSLMALALKGNTCAMFEIGELYYYGYVTANHQPDFYKAHEWYRKAADQNHPGAIWTLGYMIMINKYPTVPESEIDYMQAFAYFKRAYELGSYAALTDIGTLFEEGHLTNVDFEPTTDCANDDERAQRCYELADAMGYHYATNHLARLFERKGDMAQAVLFYEQSAQLIADGYTYNKLGLFYENGLGCERDPAKACAYYIRSVEDVLPNDVTGWCEFNAGRVYAGRIEGQPTYFIDFEKGLDLIYRSQEHLRLEDKDQPLCELLRILIDGEMDVLADRPKDIELLRLRVVTLIERYLTTVQSKNLTSCYQKARQVESLYNRMIEFRKTKN